MIAHEAPPDLSVEAQSIVQGDFYEHYKGPRYKVLSIARHSETLEEHVVYEDHKGALWIRPLKMFVELVSIEDEIKPRFRHIN